MQMEGKKLGGRYEIVSRVGGGGMAVVYKAKDLLLNRFVAIKVLSESLSNDSEFIRRFSREAQAAASLSHPNIVNVYDVGRDGYTHYIVMELVEGPTLKQYIQERGPLPVKEAAEIAIQICDGLAHAHENQIVHRDIKPHNILLGANGRVKVTDFGIARAASSSTITQTGSVMGSVHYFSPEQARGGVIGEKSDIYSLGIVLYEMLTGQLPFDGDSAISIALKHLQEPVVDPRQLNSNIPDNIASILLRALEKDPSMRYTSAKAMMQDITYAVQMDRRLEPAWVNHGRPQQQEYYQTIPLSLDDETERNPVATAVETESPRSASSDRPNSSPYQSPLQRPEIRSSQTRKEKAQRQKTGAFSSGTLGSIGQKTMMNLERLRNLPNDQDKTVFQRTVIWLDNVQQNLPLWQKIVFGIFTVALIFGLSLWGFITVWGWFVNGNEKADGAGNAVKIPAFATVQEAQEFAKKHSLKLDIKREPKAGVEKDQIIKQEPDAETELKGKPTITLVVGAGGKLVEDDYVGSFESRVRDKFGVNDLKPIFDVSYCNNGSPVTRRGYIFKQSPNKGEPLEDGKKIRLWIWIPNGSTCQVP